ncbi:MAG TPA: zinc-binding dehydrogenase [Acidimicrobiia bacterium]
MERRERGGIIERHQGRRPGQHDWEALEGDSHFLAKRSQSDLVILRELIESAEVTPIVDRTYGLDEVPEAIRCLEEGHARGKVAVKI